MRNQQPPAATGKRPAPSRLIRRLVFFTALLSLSVSIAGYALRKSAASAASEHREATEKEEVWSPARAPQLDFGGSWGSPTLLPGAPSDSEPASGLIGLDGVSVGSTRALVDSFDSATGPYGAGNNGSAAVLISNGAVSVEGSKVYGDVRSTASGVTLKGSSLVTGDVVAGMDITNGGTIKGSATPNSPSASVNAQAVAPCSPYSPADGIGGKFTYDAAKGDLTINGNGAATLAAGSYCFHNLTLAGGGRLRADGRVTVRLTGRFSAAGNSSSVADGVPSNLRILSSYSGGDGVTLSGTADLYMTIYAPQTGVSLTGRPQLYGSVLGRTLSLTGNPSLHFDSRLASAATNAAPVVDAGNAQTVTLPGTATLAGSATDDGLPNPPGTLTYQWSQVSGPAAASITNPTQPSTTVTFPSEGAYVFRLTASDGALGGGADVQVTVNPPVNHAPVVNAGTNQTITLPAAATLNGAASDDGLPNPPGALAFQWSQLSGPAQASIADPTQPSTTVSFAADGAYVFQFTASDGALSGSETVQVTVNPPANQAPTVSAGAEQTVTLPAAASLNGVAGDDGLPSPPAALTLSWSQVSGPVPALVSAPAQAATAASFTRPGTYVLELTANDGALSSSATTQVTVLDGPPTLAPLPDRTIPAGTKYSVRLSADDPNTADTLSYFLDSAPAGASLSPSRAIVWTPTSAQVGVNDFTVRVEDAAGHSDSRTFRITVEAANHAPRLAEQADERVPSGGHFSRALGATDPEGDALTYGLVNGPAGLTLSGNQLSWNPVAATPGDYPVTVKVADAAGLIDSKRFNLSVFAASASAVRDDSYEVSVGQTLDVPAAGVLANDADPNGGGALTAAKLTDPDKGAVSAFNADGSFTYVAPPTQGGPALDVKRALAFGNNWPGIGTPLVADVDGDGKPDIISAQSVGTLIDLRAYRGDTGADIFSFHTLPPAQVGGLYCTNSGGQERHYAVADVDDDGRVEIVTGIWCSDGPDQTRVAAVAYDASLPEGVRVKWLSEPIVERTHYMNAPWKSNFTVARLNPGEKPVVLLGGTGIGHCSKIPGGAADAACRGVWALKGDDGSLYRFYYSAPANQSNVSPAYDKGTGHAASGGLMGPVVADVDDDGVPEILYEGTLWNADGTVRRQFDGETNSATQSSVVVNLDGDAQMEIVTLDASNWGAGVGLLQAWEPGGQLIWRVPLPRSSVATKLSVADVDRDARPDIIFGIFNTLWVIDHAGRIKWLRNMSGPADGFGFQFSMGTSHGATFPVYDLNGDGTPEMLVVYGGNTVRFLRADTGEDQISWTHPGSPVWRGAHDGQTPIVADVDGSGHASVVFMRTPSQSCGGCDGLVHVLRGDTVPWQPAPTHYNQHAYWESNFNADGSVPQTYARQTTDPRTNVFGQQPQAPYAPGFPPASDTSFTYAATNAAGLSGTATVNIRIAPQNSPPKFTSKPPSAYVGNHGQTDIHYQAHAVDPDPGDTITFGIAATISDSGWALASADPNTGLVHLSRLYFGDHTFVITATDSHGAVGYQTITLRPASGMTSVPGVVGMTQADAASSLTAAQLAVGAVARQHTSAPEGSVLGQSPAAGTNVPQGESIDLTVSLGPAPAAVPNVVGNARTAALTTLSGGGFTATVTQVFSDAAPAGTVLAQSPAAGTFLAPTPANPVALTVSAGTGLSLSLTRSVTTADQPITVTPAAFDVNGDPAAVPALTYTIAPRQTPFAGTLPVLSGTTITPGPDTLGSFTVTATDATNSRSVSEDFAVLPPRKPGTVTNGESFAHMAEVLEQMHALREPLKAALAAGDTAQMTTLLQQMVTLWRTVDLDDLRISQPLAPPDGFAPTVEMMKGFGHSPTPDDVISHQVLKDSIEDLTAWTNGLKSSGVTMAQLGAMADRFATRAARIDGLVISPYGGINNKSQYTRLMTRAIPDFYEALTNELALLTGMPVREPSFPFLAQNAGADGGTLKPSRGALSTLPELASAAAPGRKLRGAGRARGYEPAYSAAVTPGTLAEQLVTIATKEVVERVIGNNNPYKNIKKYKSDIMGQVAYTAVAVSITSALRYFLEGQEIDAVVAGASLSFREFRSAPSWIETHGNDDPVLNIVMVIGPDMADPAKELIERLKKGYKASDPGRYKNADDVRKGLKDMNDAFKAAKSYKELQHQGQRAFQTPDEVTNGCLFSSDPMCRQLVYHDGFQSVYTYLPPPGFRSLGGLPVPIIFIVYDAADGGMSFGTPSFLPCTYTDDKKTMIQCPNSEPTKP